MKTLTAFILIVMLQSPIFAAAQDQYYALVEIWEESNPIQKQGGDGTATVIEWSLRTTSVVRATTYLLDRDTKNSPEIQKETEKYLSTVKVEETEPGSRIFKVWLDADRTPQGRLRVDMLIRTLIASGNLEKMDGAKYPYKLMVLPVTKK